MKMRSALCILSIRPSEIWLEFLNNFETYDLYMVCDDNNNDYNKIWGSKFPKIQFVQIPNQESMSHGYANLSSAISPRQIVGAWDKVLFYFAKINTSYDHVWIIEEDLYFHSEQTLLDIDSKYPNSDLLTNKVTPKAVDMRSTWCWHWCLITINLPEPHYRSMVCGIRVSRNLFNVIDTYAKTNGTLFYLEPFFPTLAAHYKLHHDQPTELSCVEYSCDWSIEHINRTHLFHPVKNLQQHADYREVDRFPCYT